jgi:pteridine reductase
MNIGAAWRSLLRIGHSGLLKSLGGIQVQGKVILVTGGAKRVGAAICRCLHAAGANVMIHYRSASHEARALQAELNLQRPGSVATVQADLLNMAMLPPMVAQTIEHFGRLDGLVNNASSFYPTPVGEINERNWDDLIGSNLKGAVVSGAGRCA